MKSHHLAILGATLALSSCTSYQQSGAVIGGVAGGLAGAAFGDDHQDVIAGAAVGAGLGAGAAALHENDVRRRNYDRYGIPAPQDNRSLPPQRNPYEDDYQDYDAPRLDSRAPDPEPREHRRSTSYPTAEPSGTPGQVISPYAPHGKIDVSGFNSGQLAKDPSSGKIFRVP